MIAPKDKHDSFIISDYLDFLEQSPKEKGKFKCPVCETFSLSINKDGKRYWCYKGCHCNEIAYSLRQLNGEFNGNGKAPKPSQQANGKKPQVSQETSELRKISNAPECIAWLERNYGNNQVAYNVRQGRIEVNGQAIDANTIRTELGKKFNIHFSLEILLEGLLTLANSNKRDPVREYLEGINGLPIPLEGLAGKLFGSDEILHDVYLRKWLIGCVARVFQPGCKFDEILVLAGPQGIGKSSFFATIANGFFSDSMGDGLDKDDLAILREHWVNEWSELDSLTAKACEGKVKAFLSRQKDSYRPPYGRDILTVPRASVLVGTSNRNDFLRDSTGSRRFWIIPCSKPIDIDWLEENRDGIWLSAMMAYQSGETWKLPKPYWGMQAEANREFERRDPWQEILEPYLESQRGIHTTSKELLEKLRDSGYQVYFSKGDEMRLGDILRQLGWERVLRRVNSKPARVWEWTDPSSM